MSLLSFQSALAYVIRSYDAHNTKSLDELTRLYDMTPEEVLTLENLINQQRLKAYSEELFLARWTIIREALEFLDPLVKLRDLCELFERDFEKKNITVVCEELAFRFVEYLVQDPVGSKFIRTDTKPFLPDLLKYIQAVFAFRHNVLPKMSPRKHSLLTEQCFVIVKLEYDVREFFAELMELEDFSALNLKEPPCGDIILLFTSSDEVTEFRSFEIDQELTDFLEGQLRGELPVVIPSCYDDLVDVGLCQQRGIKRPCCNKTH